MTEKWLHGQTSKDTHNFRGGFSGYRLRIDWISKQSKTKKGNSYKINRSQTLFHSCFFEVLPCTARMASSLVTGSKCVLKRYCGVCFIQRIISWHLNGRVLDWIWLGRLDAGLNNHFSRSVWFHGHPYTFCVTHNAAPEADLCCGSGRKIFRPFANQILHFRLIS
jgi:hypothetical protein